MPTIDFVMPKGAVTADLFVHRGRFLRFQIFPERPPRIHDPRDGGWPEFSLCTTTLFYQPEIGHYLCTEVDRPDDVLLLFDTYDPGKNYQCHGGCISSNEDPFRLRPLWHSPSKEDPGVRGLLVLSPGQHILLQSSATRMMKLIYTAPETWQSEDLCAFEREALRAL